MLKPSGHLGTLLIPIKNLKCLKNTENAEWIYFAENWNPRDGWTVSSFCMSMHAFLIHFRFSMGIIKVAWWFRHNILNLKHLWQSKFCYPKHGIFCTVFAIWGYQKYPVLPNPHGQNFRTHSIDSYIFLQKPRPTEPTYILDVQFYICNRKFEVSFLICTKCLTAG